MIDLTRRLCGKTLLLDEDARCVPDGRVCAACDTMEPRGESIGLWE